MEAESKLEGHTQYVTITNRRAVSLDFYLEPWGASSVLPPGETFFVWTQAPMSDFVEIEYADQSVTVFVPHEAIAKVFHGETLLIDQNEPFFGFPDRMTIRQAFNTLGMPRQEELEEDSTDEEG